MDGIAQSGKLQSGADLTGGSTSFDAKGTISVTSPATITETLGDLESVQQIITSGKEVKRAGYIDILDGEVPLVCTFVHIPNNETDAHRGENGGNVMANADLHSSSFVGLLTSSELVDRARGIMIMHGLDPDKVMPYTDFLQKMPGICEKVGQDFPYTGTYKPPVEQASFSVQF